MTKGQPPAVPAKRRIIMKIAAAYDNGKIFQHFGETRYFKVYETNNGTITGAEIVSAGDASHAALVDFLSALGADALICGGMGERAFRLLEEAGIKVYGGVQGDADRAVNDLLADRLIFDPLVYVGHKCGCPK